MREGGTHAPIESTTNKMLVMPQNWLSYREALKDKRVQLWNESKTEKIGEVIIMYVYPHDLVNFAILGDDSIGIGIEGELEAELQPSMCDIGSIGLIKWPIKQVTILDGHTLLQYKDLQNTDDAFDMDLDHVVLVEPLSRKRKYSFQRRKPKRTDIVLAKRTKKVSQEVIQLISTIDCCKSSCCQCASRDSLLTLRKDFWSQSLQKRTDYVYDTLGVAWHQNPSGKMDYVFSINGMVICCRAWYDMHSITKTSFY